MALRNAMNRRPHIGSPRVTQFTKAWEWAQSRCANWMQGSARAEVWTETTSGQNAVVRVAIVDVATGTPVQVTPPMRVTYESTYSWVLRHRESLRVASRDTIRGVSRGVHDRVAGARRNPVTGVREVPSSAPWPSRSRRPQVRRKNAEERLKRGRTPTKRVMVAAALEKVPWPTTTRKLVKALKIHLGVKSTAEGVRCVLRRGVEQGWCVRVGRGWWMGVRPSETQTIPAKFPRKIRED